MNHILLALIFSIGSIMTTHSQIQKGTSIIQGFYGYKLFNSKATNLGPIGGKIDYSVSDISAIGLEFCYTIQKVVNSGYLYDNPENSFSNQEFVRQISAITLNYTNYFINKPSFCVSFQAGIGVRIIQKNYYLVDEDDSDPITHLHGLATSYQDFPLAIKLRIGANYFITNRFGLNISAGLGQGGIVNAGLCYKIHK